MYTCCRPTSPASPPPHPHRSRTGILPPVVAAAAVAAASGVVAAVAAASAVVTAAVAAAADIAGTDSTGRTSVAAPAAAVTVAVDSASGALNRPRWEHCCGAAQSPAPAGRWVLPAPSADVVNWAAPGREHFDADAGMAVAVAAAAAVKHCWLVTGAGGSWDWPPDQGHSPAVLWI